MTAAGRVLKAAQVTGLATPLAPLALPQSAVPKAAVLPRPVAEAKAEAVRVVHAAKLRAEQLMTDARRAASELQLTVAAEARAAAMAELAAHHLALRERETRLDATQLERGTELARLLAERLIEESLQLDPQLVGRLARRTLQQLRDRSALVARVHPDDADEVAKQIAAMGLTAVSLVPDTSQRRGELCVDSDLGRLELRIGPGLDRLVHRVRSLLHDTP